MGIFEKQTDAVTGAFGYTGKYITRRLLDKGHHVITLTSLCDRHNPFYGRVEAHPFNFDNPGALTESLKGVTVLYNTYWVRFNHKWFINAVQNTMVLFTAARQAGVERIVHISITNPSENSPLEYFSSKAKLESALKESGMSYAILRPTVLFGKEGILINNIAWALRHLPLFGVFGNGEYRLQPIYIDDFARLAVRQGEQRTNTIIDAVGPETFTYRSLVEIIAEIIKKKRLIVGMPPWLGYAFCSLIGILMRDVVITRDEIRGLIAELLYVDSPPVGNTKLTDWARAHADSLGRHYSSELARRRERKSQYREKYEFS